MSSARDAAVWLEDVRSASAKILHYVGARSLDEFLADEACQLIAERLMITLGEACVQIRQHHPGVATQIPNIDQICAMRNRFVHGYWTIDPVLLFGLCAVQLPMPRKVAERLLARHGSGPPSP
jgi:uncharacterized protein with HEPN domain